MSTEAEREKSFDDLNALIITLGTLDERGLVVSLGSFAEEALGGLIASFLRKNSSTRSLISGFNAPFGSFSGKIRGCHALGLVTDEQYSDLEHLRKMRNAYAHTWKRLSFSDEPVRSHINALSYPDSWDEFPETLRQKATQSLSFLLVELGMQADQIHRKGLGARIIGRRLFAGLSGSASEQRQELDEKLAAINAELPTADREKRRYLEASKRHCAILEKTLAEQ